MIFGNKQGVIDFINSIPDNNWISGRILDKHSPERRSFIGHLEDIRVNENNELYSNADVQDVLENYNLINLLTFNEEKSDLWYLRYKCLKENIDYLVYINDILSEQHNRTVKETWLSVMKSCRGLNLIKIQDRTKAEEND